MNCGREPDDKNFIEHSLINCADVNTANFITDLKNKMNKPQIKIKDILEPEQENCKFVYTSLINYLKKQNLYLQI